MRTIRSTFFATSVLALALGCAPSNPGLVAEGVVAPDTMCVYAATNALLIEGTLDLEQDVPAMYRPGGITYFASFRVDNQLINNGRVYPLMADPDRIVINSAEVTLLDARQQMLSIAGVSNPYLVPATGAIASTQSMDPTLGVASATIINNSAGTALASRYAPDGTIGAGSSIVASVRIIGTTAGGATLTSGPVVFPINLCVGCLYQPACDTMHNPILSLSCQSGQDSLSRIPPTGGC